MTRVDFYVIPSADPSARLQVACRLAEKAWRLFLIHNSEPTR
ncbi:DNA polymerase III subunit chi, partial [Pseudomonas aeruginosa]|nr:DNA polymerase III subunit chi [Pseudomonas aeruginosa]